MLKRILDGANIPVPQNWALFDLWSLTHIAWGVGLGWVMNPVAAFALMLLYEPVEVYLLSPFLFNNFGIVFGNEGLYNSLTDLAFNTIGILFGYYVLRYLIPPPFTIL